MDAAVVYERRTKEEVWEWLLNCLFQLEDMQFSMRGTTVTWTEADDEFLQALLDFLYGEPDA